MIGDIEDSVELTQRLANDSVRIHVDKKKPSQSHPSQTAVYVKTWGCSHNNSDAEYMAGLLAAHGYQIILDDAHRDDAQLVDMFVCA